MEDAEVANDSAAADIFVAGEILAVADQSQVDESQVLVQPADVLYSEVGHGDGNEESHDKVIVSETTDNLSMEVQLSDEICKAGLDSGSAMEDKSHSVNHKKFKRSENVASGCSDALEQQPSLLNLLTSYLPGLFRRATFQMRGQMRLGIVFILVICLVLILSCGLT